MLTTLSASPIMSAKHCCRCARRGRMSTWPSLPPKSAVSRNRGLAEAAMPFAAAASCASSLRNTVIFSLEGLRRAATSATPLMASSRMVSSTRKSTTRRKRVRRRHSDRKDARSIKKALHYVIAGLPHETVNGAIQAFQSLGSLCPEACLGFVEFVRRGGVVLLKAENPRSADVMADVLAARQAMPQGRDEEEGLRAEVLSGAADLRQPHH
eukprot:scaffold2724_cov260-Pinguiococcus_pyrenoidosus.AAC.19